MEPIYLDNASTSFPKPPQVAQAMFDYVTGCGCNIGRGGKTGRRGAGGAGEHGPDLCGRRPGPPDRVAVTPAKSLYKPGFLWYTVLSGIPEFTESSGKPRPGRYNKE